MVKKILIEGMSCGHCANHVAGALKAVCGVKRVKRVDASVYDGFAIVELIHEVSDDKLKAAVEEAGYKAVDIQEI